MKNCNHWKFSDFVLDLNYFSFSQPNPNPNTTYLPKHEFLSSNNQVYQRIWYGEYYSVHVYMVSSQKFCKSEIWLDTGSNSSSRKYAKVQIQSNPSPVQWSSLVDSIFSRFFLRLLVVLIGILWLYCWRQLTFQRLAATESPHSSCSLVSWYQPCYIWGKVLIEFGECLLVVLLFFSLSLSVFVLLENTTHFVSKVSLNNNRLVSSYIYRTSMRMRLYDHEYDKRQISPWLTDCVLPTISVCIVFDVALTSNIYVWTTCSLVLLCKQVEFVQLMFLFIHSLWFVPTMWYFPWLTHSVTAVRVMCIITDTLYKSSFLMGVSRLYLSVIWYLFQLVFCILGPNVILPIGSGLDMPVDLQIWKLTNFNTPLVT